MFHIFLHFLVPFVVALAFTKKQFRMPFLIMMATMVIDIDHLLADPIYDPNRCSINFHPLHKLYMIPLYVALTIYSKTRWVGAGLVIHMILDGIDCQVNTGVWFQE